MSDRGADQRFELGSRLIVEAAELALRFNRSLDSLTVTAKGTQDVVSEADVEVERLIRTRLAEHFPADAFFGEESGRGDVESAEYTWVVDPIDGSQPFLSGLSSWCVSIGLARAGVLQQGFLAAPGRDEIFIGRVGHGATLNGRPITVSTSERLDDGLLSIGMSPRIGADDILPMFEQLLREGVVYYREGSGALSLAYVAAGRLIGYLEPHLNSWDGAAGVALVLAAGGRVNHWFRPDTLLTGAPIAAGPSAIYPQLCKVLGVDA